MPLEVYQILEVHYVTREKVEVRVILEDTRVAFVPNH